MRKARRSWLAQGGIALLCAGLYMPVACLADSAQDPPPMTPEEESINSRHRAMLRARQFEQLDQDMNELQKAFENGRVTDIRLHHLFRAFYDTSPQLAPLYAEWTKRFPRSYAAHEAQAIYYRRVSKGIFFFQP